MSQWTYARNVWITSTYHASGSAYYHRVNSSQVKSSTSRCNLDLRLTSSTCIQILLKNAKTSLISHFNEQYSRCFLFRTDDLNHSFTSLYSKYWIKMSFFLWFFSQGTEYTRHKTLNFKVGCQADFYFRSFLIMQNRMTPTDKLQYFSHRGTSFWCWSESTGVPGNKHVYHVVGYSGLLS